MNILDGLNGTPPTGAATMPAAATEAPAAPPDAAAPHPLQGMVQDLISGKVAAVYIPKNYSNPNFQAPDPKALVSMGLALYSPKHDKDVAAVVGNPQLTTHAELVKMDKDGKLDKNFPSIATFLPHVDPTVGAEAGSPVAAPLPAAPSQTPVPVLPASGLSGSALGALAAKRASNFAPQIPSARQVPGAGAVLNGLMRRPV